MKNSLARTALLMGVLCFSLPMYADGASVQHSLHQLRAVEKSLRKHLANRVLVFRKGEIGRHHIRFDSRGHTASESGLELKSRRNAILFTGLTLDREHLVIVGEAARIRAGMPEPVLSRHPREFSLITCTILLDVSPDEITFTHAIRLLCQMFLTREEFQRLPHLEAATWQNPKLKTRAEAGANLFLEKGKM